MKSIRTLRLCLLYASLLLSTIQASAQNKWGVGYRTGPGQNNWHLNTSDFKSNNLQWHHQVFLSRHIIKGLEAELSFQYNRQKESYTYSYFGSDENNHVNATYHNASLLLTARYKIINIGPLSLYPQIGISAATTFYKEEKHITTNGMNTKTQLEQGRKPISKLNTLFPGFGADYKLSKRIFLTANFNAHYKHDSGTNLVTNLNQNDWSTSLLLGAGLRL